MLGGEVGVRFGEGCHMIGSPSGELLKKPLQQSGQGLNARGRKREREGEGERKRGRKRGERGGGALQYTTPLHSQSLKREGRKITNTQAAVVLLTILISLLSGHFYSKSVPWLSVSHIFF